MEENKLWSFLTEFYLSGKSKSFLVEAWDRKIDNCVNSEWITRIAVTYDNFLLAGMGGGILFWLVFGLFGSGGEVVLGMEFCLSSLQPLLAGMEIYDGLLAAAAVVTWETIFLRAGGEPSLVWWFVLKLVSQFLSVFAGRLLRGFSPFWDWVEHGV